MREITFERKNIRVLVGKTAEECAEFAAAFVTAQMAGQKAFKLGLATGSTPVLLYRELIKKNQAGEIDFSGVNTYNLDEYYPIDPKDAQSFREFMEENLFRHVNLPPENIHIPCGNAPDGKEEAKRYEKELCDIGGVDLQVLGIGSDGHVGFNEPDSIFPYETHTTALTEQTIRDNSRFFESEDQVPRNAITMGCGAIMRAKKCILIATGKNKAQAIHDAILADPAPSCQASVLQFHQDTVFVLDEDAASLL